MPEHFLIGLGLILIIGIAAQWIAWKIHLPAILLLLICGIVAGPVTGLIHPDQLLGNTLFPIVSLSVAVILFEGGLSLRVDELREIGGVIFRLIAIGISITWVLSSLFAYWLLDFNIYLSVLFGAILIVTGPTVIIPLLRQVRPSGQVGSILKWEGIVNDPIGASVAVLVFEVIMVSGTNNGAGVATVGAIKTLVFGVGVGLAGATIMYFLLKRHLIPDFLQNPITLMLVVAAFMGANLLQEESGLLAVTVMGFALANQKSVRVKHIIEFKENLRVILISLLFIILAARLQVSDLEHLNWSIVLFLVILILVVRPAAVYASTIGSKLNWKERFFLVAMAPRGIVAAAVSAIFAFRLSSEGYSEASLMIPYIFVVIIGTVTVYGLMAAPLARKLGVAKPVPRGLWILGAQNWVRKMALELKELGFRVIVTDTNWYNIREARMSGLETYYGNILAEYALNEINLDGIGHFLAMTPNDEVNSLATLRFSEILGRSEVYQLTSETAGKKGEISGELNGRILFKKQLNELRIKTLFSEGAELRATNLTEEFDYNTLLSGDDQFIIPAFLITQAGDIRIFATDNPPEPQPGQRIVSLTIDREKAPEWLLEKTES